MRVVVVVLLIAAFGCREKAAPPPPVERTAPVAPGQPFGADKPDRARVELDLANARAAVRSLSQINGAFPKSIDEMGVKFFYPADLVYDAATGLVKSKTYPML